MKRTNTFDIEITDTFDGDANYCWVDRFQVESISVLGAIQQVSRRTGYTWRQAWDGGDDARYDAQGQCVCCFVTYHDDYDD